MTERGKKRYQNSMNHQHHPIFLVSKLSSQNLRVTAFAITY